MKFDIKVTPKICRDIAIAVLAGCIFLLSFFIIYDAALKKDLERIETRIEEAKYRYACFVSNYDRLLKRHKQKDNHVNVFLLQQLKPLLSDGLTVYFSNEASFSRADRQFKTSRRLANHLLATQPPFCLKLSEAKIIKQ